MAIIVISWLKCISCIELSQPYCRNVLSTITFDLVSGVSILGHYFYCDLALFNYYLYLLANIIQLAPVLIDQLRTRIAEIFKSAVFLVSLTTCIDKNFSWFALSLLFEKVVFLQSDSNCSRGNSESNKGNSGSENKVEFVVKKNYIYRKDKKLL